MYPSRQLPEFLEIPTRNRCPGGAPLQWGDPQRATKGGPHAKSKGQSGKGPGDLLPQAPCVTKEETVARRMKDIPGRMA